jgi:hypothetical protein
MEFLMMEILAAHLGTLSFGGLIGRPLFNYFCQAGSVVVQHLNQACLTDGPNREEAINQAAATLVDGGIFFVPKDGNQRPYFLKTNNMTPEIAHNFISARTLNIYTPDHGSFDMQGGSLAALAPKKPTDPRLQAIMDEMIAASNRGRSVYVDDTPVLNLNTGAIRVQGGSIITDGTGALISTREPIVLESTADRHYTSSGHQDVKRATRLSIEKSLTVSSAKDIILKSIEVTNRNGSSSAELLFKTTGHIFDIPLMLETYRTYIEQNNDGDVFVRETRNHASTSNYKNVDVTFEGDTITSYAPTFMNTMNTAAKIKFIAQSGVTILDVLDHFSRQTEQHIDGDGFFSKDKDIYTAYYNAQSRGMDAGNVKVEIILKEKGDVDLTNVKIKDLTVDVKGGTINFHLGKNFTSYSRSEKGSNAFYQYQRAHQSSHETATQSDVGSMHVVSDEANPGTINIEQVRGKAAEFMKRIEMDHGQITEQFWDEVHKEINFYQGGPTAACAVLVAIAVSAATIGTGLAASAGTMFANGIGFAGSGAAATMGAAGFTSLCVSATMAVVNAEGDPRKAAKAFLSTDTLKSTGMSMLTAGATYGLLSGLELPTNISELKDLGDHALNQGVNSVVKIGADLATSGRVDGTAVALGAVAGTIGSYLSTKIGDWHGGALNTAENELVHDVLHTLKGAGEGYIVGGEKGMAAGALGAFVAEKTAKFMMPTGGINREGAVNPKYTDDMKRKTMAIARLVTGMVAFSTGMSADQIDVAMLSANTSLDHNFAGTVGKSLEKDEKEPADENAGLSIDGKKFKPRYNTRLYTDDGYESDTSYAFRMTLEKCENDWDVAKASGLRPSVDQNKALYNARQAYDQRQEDRNALKSATLMRDGVSSTAQDVYHFAKHNPFEAAWVAGENVPFAGTAMTLLRNTKEVMFGQTTLTLAALDVAVGFGGAITRGVVKGGKTAVNAVKLSGKSAAANRATNALDLAGHSTQVPTKTKVYMTYNKPHPNPDIVPYTGQTSGTVTDMDDLNQLDKILRTRDRNHHMNAQGFEPPVLDHVSTNPDVITGLEQINIDIKGGARSTGGTSSNAINGISEQNPERMKRCVDAAVEEIFGIVNGKN